jgi:hypothetical protein
MARLPAKVLALFAGPLDLAVELYPAELRYAATCETVSATGLQSSAAA